MYINMLCENGSLIKRALISKELRSLFQFKKNMRYFNFNFNIVTSETRNVMHLYLRSHGIMRSQCSSRI